MKFNQVVITPEDEAALSACLSELVGTDGGMYFKDNLDRANKWVAYVRDVLYYGWSELPNGSHLKAAYQDDVWAWSDTDLAD